MKVGIITYHRTTNYGACLQALATQTVISSMGMTPVIIDYDPDAIALTYAHFSAKKYSSLLRNPKQLLRIIGSDIRYAGINKKLDGAFSNFYKKYYKLSEHHYKTYDELKKDPPQLDACITGSDQVWNSDITKGFDPSYFLKFGQENMRRISYAASIGKESLSETERTELLALIESLDGISVRESRGREMLKGVTSRKINVCPDPTLLLTDNEWCELFAIEPKDGKYIFVYSLYQNPELDNVVMTLHEKTGLPIVRIGNRAIYQDEQTINIADPRKFVELIANATFVVTNSFHGTAFATNFSKTFWCVLGKSRNARMLNLLSTIGLKNRADFKFVQLDTTPLDYSLAKRKLEEYRMSGLSYLRKELAEND